MTAEQIKENLLAIKEKISEAEKKSSRESGSVKLCAVSKFHPAEDVIADPTSESSQTSATLGNE